MENQFVKVDGCGVRYIEAGEGRPIVMLHGLGFNASADQFRLSMELLSNEYRTIALDMVGWGLSDRPKDGYSFPFMISILEGFLDALELRESVLVGHTLGGWTSALVALKSPERVTKLVLATTAGLNPRAPSNASGFTLLTREETRKALEGTFGDPTIVTEAMLDDEYARQQRVGTEEAYIAVLDFVNDPVTRREWSLESRLPKIECPILVVWGSDDPILGSALGTRAVQLAPNGKLVLIDGGDHVPLARRPVEFSAALRAFLKE